MCLLTFWMNGFFCSMWSEPRQVWHNIRRSQHLAASVLMRSVISGKVIHQMCVCRLALRMTMGSIHVEVGRGDKLENFDFNFFPTSKTWKGLLTTNSNNNLRKNIFRTPLYRGSENSDKCIGYGQNVFQWTSNEPLWHLKLNWLTTLDPLASLFASNAYFQLKGPYFKYLAI